MAYHLTSELRAFAAAQLGPLQAVRFCGWPHAESSVWAVTGAEQAFLKVFRQPRKFVQERRAYRAWLPGLGFQGTPRLLAESSELRALLISARPGSLLEHAHPNEVQRLEAYRQAGAWLRALHALPFVDDDPVPLAEAYTRRGAAWLGRAAGLLEPTLISWVGEQVESAVKSLEQLGAVRVPCHRDYSPRNWLVDLSGGNVQLSVIDFEHARPDHWLVDVERLYAGGWDSSLEDAFWQGYGRVLSELERKVLRQRLALSALSSVVWAREHGDADFERQGRRQLAALYGRAEAATLKAERAQ